MPGRTHIHEIGHVGIHTGHGSPASGILQLRQPQFVEPGLPANLGIRSITQPQHDDPNITETRITLYPDQHIVLGTGGGFGIELFLREENGLVGIVIGIAQHPRLGLLQDP